MEEVREEIIHKFIKESLISTIIPVLFSSSILTYILNINAFISIPLSMLLIYLIELNVIVNYCKNKNKKIGVINLILGLLVLTMVIKIFLQIDTFKIFLYVFLIITLSHILCKNILNKKDL